jgi:hypothetical protein
MNPRIIAALTVGLTSVTAGHALAAPVKKACKIVTDGTGDTFAVRQQDTQAKYGPIEDGFDITSADIASDGKVITAVIRVKKLTSAVQTSPTGVAFGFDFSTPTAPTATLGSLRAIVFNGGAPYYEAVLKTDVPSGAQNYTTFLATVTGVWDTAHNEVRITAPVSVFSALGTFKKGVTISPDSDSATSGRPLPIVPGQAGQPSPSRFVFADVALDGKSIKVGAPSCVTPGK